MPDTTPVYGWTLPTSRVDSWITTIDSAFQGIDAAIGSLDSLNAKPHVTLALSYHAVGDGIQFPKGIGAFRVMSAAPYGAFVGSFGVVGSGSTLLVDFQLLATSSGFFGTLPSATPDPDFRIRLVVNPGSLVFPDPTTGFLFRTFGMQTGRGWTATGWAAASLGPGNYSIGIDQWTVNSAQFGLHGLTGYCQLVVYEG